MVEIFRGGGSKADWNSEFVDRFWYADQRKPWSGGRLGITGNDLLHRIGKVLLKQRKAAAKSSRLSACCQRRVIHGKDLRACMIDKVARLNRDTFNS